MGSLHLFRAAWNSPLALLLAVGVYGGISITLFRAAGSAGAPPLNYVFWASLIGGLLLTGWSVLHRARGECSRRVLPFFAITGGVGALMQVLQFAVVNKLGAGLAGMLFALSPAATYAIALPTRLDRVDPLRISGLLIGLCGAVTLLAERSGLDRIDGIGWLFVALLIPVVSGSITVYRSHAWPRPLAPLALAGPMGLITGLVLLLPAWLLEGLVLPWALPGRAPWILAVHGLIGAAAFAAALHLQRLAGPVYLSQVMYLTTASSVVLGITLYDERYGPLAWIALACIAASVALVNKRQPAAR
jgi:drug/metabolite transporter (DMT)-like permease